MTHNQLIINPIIILRILSRCALFLMIASTIGQLVRMYTGHNSAHGLIPLFYLDNEVNLPSYFAMFILLCASMLLLLITKLEKMRSSPLIVYWTVLWLGFLLMSIDEMISVHEGFTWPLRQLLGTNIGIFYNAWVLVGIPVVVLIGLFFYRFLFSLSVKTRRVFLTAAAIYLTGLIGIEIIGGFHAKTHGASDITYLALVTIEECLEMLGIIIFNGGLLDYIADNFTCVQLIFKSTQ